MLEKPASIEAANKYQQKIFLKGGLFLFVFGMLLPPDWRQTLGLFGEWIFWMAETIPSVRKAAAVSPIKELVQGFFGTAFLFLPLFYVAFTWRDPLGLRFKYGLDRATSKVKYLGSIYLLGLPTIGLLLYLILFLPWEVHLGLTPTRGQMLFSLMISYRLSLALFGALLIMGACGFLWLLTILLAGPFLHFYNRIDRHGK